MAIAYISSGSVTTPSGSAASVIVPVPAGTLDNHGMILGVTYRSTTASINTPAGWTLTGCLQNSLVAMTVGVWSRIASSEPANYTVTVTACANITAQIVTYSGTNTTVACLINAIGFQQNASSASIVAPSITTNVNGAQIVGIYSVAGAVSVLQPPGTTERSDAQSGAAGGNAAQEISDENQATNGATGTRTACATANYNAGTLLALAPVASGLVLRSYLRPTGIIY